MRLSDIRNQESLKIIKQNQNLGANFGISINLRVRKAAQRSVSNKGLMED